MIGVEQWVKLASRLVGVAGGLGSLTPAGVLVTLTPARS